MFERKLNEVNLGKKSKELLRQFTGKSRMNEEQYYVAVKKYNAEVDKRKTISKSLKQLIDVLPTYIDNDVNELKRTIKAYQQKQIEKKQQKIQAQNIIIDLKLNTLNEKSNYGNLVQLPLLQVAKKIITNKNKIVYIQTSMDGNVFKSDLLNVDTINATTLYWDINKFIETYVNGELINIFNNSERYGRIVIFENDKAPSKKILQKYRDGVKHCVIEPIRATFQQYADNCNSKDSKRKMLAVVKKLTEYEKIYIDGVPEEDMEIIGKACNRCIVIHNIIGNETIRYNEKSTKYFHFTNTRKNHLDTGILTCGGAYTLVSQDEMDNIVEEHDKNGEFYIMDGYVDKESNMKTIKYLSSAKGNFRTKNENYDIYNEFDKQIGKVNYQLNSIEYGELNDFIKEGRIINATPVPLNNEPNNFCENTYHIDISKAYTQHKLCKNYGGFLGNIHAYAKLDDIKNPLEFLQTHIGIYQVKIIRNKNDLLTQLGIYEKKIYTLPSVEIIDFILEYGITIKLIAGCWGSRFDFDYTEDMLEDKRYAVWAGKLGYDVPYNKYTFTGDEEWANHLKYELGNDNVFYFKPLNLITIKIDKKYNATYHHIFAFITSYTRMNMLKVMSSIKGELIKVIMDGIYFRGEIEPVAVPYKHKELVNHIGFRQFWYYPSIINTSKWAKYNPDFDGNCILAGAGGTGKTYSVYTYKGLIKPLYVVPTHILGRKMKETYGCKYTTINRLVGDGCISYKEKYGYPSCILIDELTMTDKKYIEKAIEMYPSSLILLAGDIDGKQWFQCRNGNADKYNELFIPDNWRYVFYNVDRRSKDDEIKNLKIAIRNKMKEVFIEGGSVEANIINWFIQTNYNVLSFADAVNEFKSGDVWIAGTHATNKKLIEKGVLSGYINADKEINFNGDGEKRGSFTIHSYQGLTIEKEKVFISLDTFEYAMLYTAVSRCRSYEQIRFVSAR